MQKHYDYLLIMPKFHGYEKKYISAIKTEGTVFDFCYDESDLFSIKHMQNIPSVLFHGFLISMLKVLNFIVGGGSLRILSLVNKYRNRFINKNNSYLKRKLKNDVINVQAKMLIVVKGLGLDEDTIKWIKRECNIEVSVLYQWDPLFRFPLLIDIYKFFDHIFTFEPSDLPKYVGTKFLPTPVDIDVSSCVGVNCDDICYQFSFIGVYTSERFSLLEGLVSIFDSQNLSYYIKLVYKGRSISKIKSKIVSTKYITSDEKNSIYAKSKCIIEISHFNQYGLTQRVFEALAMNKKVLLCNEDVDIGLYGFSEKNFIRKCDFYKGMDYIFDKLNSVQHETNLDNYSYSKWASEIVSSSKINC